MRKHSNEIFFNIMQIAAMDIFHLIGINAGTKAAKMAHLTHAGRTAKRNKTGRVYPHSSTRQRARYARQIANGQLSYA